MEERKSKMERERKIRQGEKSNKEEAEEVEQKSERGRAKKELNTKTGVYWGT